MIVFNLSCSHDHEFEAWFRSNQDFEEQRAVQNLSCPICQSTNVSKALMSPNVARGGAITSTAQGSPDRQLSEMTSKIYDMAREVRSHVEANFDYVGADFPNEVRRIHKGETDDRGVYGEASAADVKELIEEGVSVAPIPDVPPKKPNKKLN